MKRFYVNDEERSEKDFWDMLDYSIENEIEENLDNIIDEENEEIKIGCLTYSPSQVLKECDPVAYRCYGDDVKNWYYEDDKYDLEQGNEVERDGSTFRIEEEEEEDEETEEF